jgi:hypothetical protein
LVCFIARILSFSFILFPILHFFNVQINLSMAIDRQTEIDKQTSLFRFHDLKLVFEVAKKELIHTILKVIVQIIFL